MMNAKIFRLFILSLSLFIASVGYAESPLRGIHLSADAFGYIYPNFVKDKFYSTELSLAVNLKNRFFPVLEAGVGHTNMVSHLYDIGYSTRAPYYRIGMDYNMQYKNGRSNYIYLGARVGYTTFKYSVDAPALIDPVWGDEASMKFLNVPNYSFWIEAVGGVRAEIAKNIYMGWSLRYKYLLHRSMAYGGPWYIPGFGTGKKTVLGATYTIGYYFNLFKKK